MSAVHVSQIVGLLERKELDVWVDGGWGVDALLQESTRPHRDLDLVVRLDQVEIVRAALTTVGVRPRLARLAAGRVGNRR
jgi:lincosamide nucleotidyltransferase A/C/D/E